jgi:hypothetical protein
LTNYPLYANEAQLTNKPVAPADSSAQVAASQPVAPTSHTADVLTGEPVAPARSPAQVASSQPVAPASGTADVLTGQAVAQAFGTPSAAQTVAPADVLTNKPVDANAGGLTNGPVVPAAAATGVPTAGMPVQDVVSTNAVTANKPAVSAAAIADIITGSSQAIAASASGAASASPPKKTSVAAPVKQPVFEFPKQNQPLVGVIDTGFAANNPDIDYSRITLGQDRVDGDANPLVSAGESDKPVSPALEIIGATQNNGKGIDGINDDAPLFAARTSGSSEQLAQSLIEFVDAAKADSQPNAIVNINLNLTEVKQDGTIVPRELKPAERAAMAYAQKHNVLVVVPAGDNSGEMSALGQLSKEFDNVITVGAAKRVNNAVALSKAYAPADYSGSGEALDISADGTSGNTSGTSVAAAKVAGAASLVWAANPKLNYTQVIDILKRTATDLGKPNWDIQTGAGLLNMAAAVSLAKVTTPEPYTVKPGQQTITDNFISQPNAEKTLPGNPTQTAVALPGIPQTTADQGANDLTGTQIRISSTQDVIDQVSAIDPMDVYKVTARELGGSQFQVLSGEASVSFVTPAGQVLSQQVLSRGTHKLQLPANAPAEVLLKIDRTGTDATYVLSGFESEASEPFNIDLEFEGGLSASQQQILQAAAKSVAGLIGKGLPSAIVDGKIIDDLNIKVSLANLDGASGTQAQTKIDFMRYGTMLPAQSITQFDAADIAELEKSGQLFSVAQHEFLHALGFGNLWEAKGLVDYAGTPLAQYNGKNAVDAFKDLGGLTDYVSLETQGDGSAGLHWNDALFKDEVMTKDLGFKSGPEGQPISPISTVTIASLVDLGYQVNLNRATPGFGLFGGQRLNPEDLTPEEIEAFRRLVEEAKANKAEESIPAIMPEVDPAKVAPEIWAHAEKFWKNNEYYDWVPYRIPSGDNLSSIALRKLGSSGYDYYMWIANHNGIPNPDYIVAGDTIEIPEWHPNYEWEQEQERLKREAELQAQLAAEAQKQKEAEEKLKNDLAEQEKLKQEQERLQQEAAAHQRELEEQAKRLAEELEKKRQKEEWEKEQARLAELARQAEIARQQGKGGLDWYLAKPLSFGNADPFEINLGDVVGNLVPDDYYRFTLSRGGRLTAELKQLLADADLVLYDARNQPISYSMREGITDEQIITDLIPGTYMLRVNSPKGVTTDYDLVVKFQHKLSMTQQGPPPGWQVGGSAGGAGGGAGGGIPAGATFADPRIEKIFRQAVEEFAAPERQKAKNQVDALKSERDRLEREKKALIEAKSAELRGQVHGMLDQVKRDRQNDVNGIANNIKGGIDWVANGAINFIGGLVPDSVFNIPFVGGWIRDRFNEAKGAIEGAINGARNWLKAKVDEVRNTINGAISWFIDQAKNLYFTAGEANIAIEGIANQLRGMIENAIAVLNGLIGQFKGMVLGPLEWTRNIGAGGWNLYDNAIVGLVNNLTNGLQDTVRNTGRFFMDRVGDAEKGVQWVIAEIGNLLGDETGRIYNQYQDQIRSLNGHIEAITNETDQRIRAKEAEYKNQIQNFLNQLGDEGKKILDTIFNFANSPEGQITIAVVEVLLGLVPILGQAIDIKDTVVPLNKISNGAGDIGTGVELLGALAGWAPAAGDAVKSIAKLAFGGALVALLAKLGPDVVKNANKVIKETPWKKLLGEAINTISTKWDDFMRVAGNMPNLLRKYVPGVDNAINFGTKAIDSLKNSVSSIGTKLDEAGQWISKQLDEWLGKIAKTPAREIMEKSLKSQGIPDEYIRTLDALDDVSLQKVTSSLDKWNNPGGVNQGYSHIISHEQSSVRLERLSDYTGTTPRLSMDDPQIISKATELLESQWDKIGKLGEPDLIRVVDGKEFRFIPENGKMPPLSQSTDGIIVLKYENKFSSFMKAEFRDFKKKN